MDRLKADPTPPAGKIAAWLPVIVMGLMSLISYLDRSTLAILSPTILRDTGLSAEQYGWIISSFSIAYTIGNPAWGYLIDRFGLRYVPALAVLLWTIASAAHAFAGSFAGFAVARAALGFGEGATFPSGLRTADETLPPERRSTGVAIAYSGGSLGALVTPLIVTPLALAFGWRSAFLFTGLAGLVWLSIWGSLNRRGPVQAFATSARPPLQLRDSRLWAFAALYAFGGLPLAFPLYAAPLYLSKVLGLPQSTIGKLIWLPPLGWEIGYFAAGRICDKWVGARNHPRAMQTLLIGFTLLNLPLAATTWISSLPLVMAVLALTMFAGGAVIVIAVRYGSAAFQGRSGFIAGLGAGSWSAVVACVMPVIGRLFDHRDYSKAFLLVTIFPLAGLLLWRWLAKPASLHAI